MTYVFSGTLNRAQSSNNLGYSALLRLQFITQVYIFHKN